MLLISINGGVIFQPKTEKEAYYIEQQYKAKADLHGYYIPEKIIKYFKGYIDEDTYSYYFDNLKQKDGTKLYYSLKTKEISSVYNKLPDGVYIVKVDSNGIPDFASMVYENHGEFLKELNKPLHIELITAVKDIILLKENFQKLHQNNLDLQDALSTDISVIKQNIDAISLTIRTIPASNGAPLNPGLVINNSNNANPKLNILDSNTDKSADYVEESNADLNDVVLEIKAK
jgi:hypothetical protein